MRTTFTRIATAAVATMATAAPAFAAPTYTDNSGILVWSFLGFCALIVALLPDERNPRCDETAKGYSTEAETST